VLKKRFKVDMKDGSPDMEISGNMLAHEYTITRGEQEVARVSKSWINIADSYGIEVAEGEDDVLMLSSVIIVDMIGHGDDKNPLRQRM